MIAEAGYAGATTNAIARHAGISPGSLYQFFDNKDAVLDALADRYLEPEIGGGPFGRSPRRQRAARPRPPTRR